MSTEEIARLIELLLEIVGTVAFAVSGALLAIEKKNDVFGVLFLGVTTAVGGGILRDMILGQLPPRAFINPSNVILALISSLVVFISMYFIRDRIKKHMTAVNSIISIFDALGLGVFTVYGMRIAAENGYGENLFLTLFVGMMTGVGGGIIRDVLLGLIPSVLRKRVYAVASLLGGAVYIMLKNLGLEAYVCVFSAVAIVVVTRQLASKYEWSLPKVRLDK